MGSIESGYYPKASDNTMSYGQSYGQNSCGESSYGQNNGLATTGGHATNYDRGNGFSNNNGPSWDQGWSQSSGQSHGQNNGPSFESGWAQSGGQSSGQNYDQNNGPSFESGWAQSSGQGCGQNNGQGYSQGNNNQSYSQGSNQSYSQVNSLKQTPTIPTLKLNDGNEIPILAFGLGSAFHGGQSDAVRNSALTAIRNGFYHLDAAEVYGNEKELGAAIRQSGVPRSQLYITTKVWTVASNVKAAFDASLERLGVDYVDLYLINWPQIADAPDRLQQIWSEMEAIKQSGRARSIGVSNFLQNHLEMILRSARIPPAVNQIEYHTYLQHGGLVDFHRQHNIVTAAYSPLAPITKAHPGPCDNTLASLARKYGVGEADIAIRWVLDQGIVAVTTSTNEERIQSLRRNLPTFKLSESEIQEIGYQGKQKHFRGYFNDIYGADDRR